MSNNQPLLTIIIFTYNHEGTIAKAIESVLEQKTEYPYEIWICEDCSTDGTLEICKKYAEQHPDRIKLFAQPVNTYNLKREQNHVYQAFHRVDTKYFCSLDGDDYWCNENKIQIALDILENNSEYVTFAHDTLVNENNAQISLTLAQGVEPNKMMNPVTYENLIYFHPSSRIHRNVIDFSNYPDDIWGDSFLFYAFVDKGPLYYYNNTMSVYNVSGNGAWSKFSENEKINFLMGLHYKLTNFFNYKYDNFFTRIANHQKNLKLLKKIFKKQLGWWLWYHVGNLYYKVCIKKEKAKAKRRLLRENK